MAHANRAEIDQAAHEAALVTQEALPDAEAVEKVLAYGAEGDGVSKLVDLLAYLGHATNNVIKGGEPVLDASVLADVDAALEELNAKEAAHVRVLEAGDVPPEGVEGVFVGHQALDVLYAAAEAKKGTQGD